MPVEDAVLEAPEFDAAQADAGEAVDHTQADGGAEAEAANEAANEAAKGAAKGDERTLPRWIRDLKATRPDDFRAAKDHFFEQKGLQEKLKDFDLDGTKSWLEEKGGREAIEQQFAAMQAKAGEFDELMQGIANGDGSLIARVAEESPEGMVRLAPEVMGAWANLDPEGYGQAVYGVLTHVLASNGLNEILQGLNYALKYRDEQGTQDGLMRLSQLFQGIQQQAFAERTTPPPGAQRPDAHLSAREQTVAQQEQGLYEQRLTGTVEATRSKAIEQQLAPFIARRRDDGDARQLAIDTVKSKVLETLAQDRKFMADLAALKGKRDQAGAAKLIASRERDVIAKIAPQVGRTIFGQAETAKPALRTATSAARRATQQRPADPRDAIFQRIANR